MQGSYRRAWMDLANSDLSKNWTNDGCHSTVTVFDLRRLDGLIVPWQIGVEFVTAMVAVYGSLPAGHRFQQEPCDATSIPKS